MFRSLLMLAVLLVSGTVSQDWEWECPEPEDVLPCICQNYTGIYHGRLVCMGIENFDIKGYFDKLPSVLDEGHIFPDIYITGTDLVEIPADAISSVKFMDMTIESNYDMKFIHPDAFSGSWDVTKYFTLGADPWIWENHTAQDMFNVVNKFKRLEVLYLYMRLIDTIPDDAFVLHPELRELKFNTVSVSYVGARAFAKLPKLEFLYLAGMNLALESFTEETFVGISSNATVDLRNNQFQTLPENIFKPLIDNARLIKVGGSECVVWWCHDLTLQCNADVDWLCHNITLYRPKLSGYLCEEAKYDDIWHYCAVKFGV